MFKHPALFGAALLMLTASALAQVHFGRNVLVGGHRLKPHDARWVKVRTITGYTGPLGCHTFSQGATIDGRFYEGPVRRCVWRAIPHARRRG